MKKHLLAAAALAAVLSAGTAFAQTPAAAPAAAQGPMIIPANLRQLTPHVWAIPDNDVALVANIGFVVGPDGVLAIDMGLGPRNGAIVAQTAAKLAPGKPVYLVTTHVHPEHDLGASAFPAGSKLIRSQDQVKDIAANGLNTANVFSGRSAVNAELLKDAQYRAADITYYKAYTLDLGGGVKVELSASGPNHTIGDTAIWVPGDGVLFTGDLAMSKSPVMAAQGATVDHWVATLDRLAALKPKIVVPSHSKLGGPEFLDNNKAFLTRAKARTAELKAQGKTVDETVATVSAELTPLFPDSGARMAGPIRAAYNAAP